MEKLQRLIRNEVLTLFSDEDDIELEPFTNRQYNTVSELGSRESNRYYVTSQGEGKQRGKLEIPRESSSRYSYGDNSRNARETDTSPNKPNPSSYLQRNYQYGLAPNAVSFDDNPKITRMNEFGSASSLNTREPASTEIYTSYPATYSANFRLPFVEGNRVYSGRYGNRGSANGRISWGDGGLVGRGLRRLGQMGGRFRGGGGTGVSYGLGSQGQGSRFGLGGGQGLISGLGYNGGQNSGNGFGLSDSLRLLGGTGSGRYNFGVNGGSDGNYYDTYASGTPSTSGSNFNIDTDGTPGGSYYQRLGSGSQTPAGSYTVTDTPIGQGGSLNIIPGGRPNTGNGQYGVQTSYTPNQDGRISYNTGNGGSRVPSPSTSSTVSFPADADSDEIQYELMFLRDRNRRRQNQGTNGDVQLQTPTSGSNNGGLRLPGTSTIERTPDMGISRTQTMSNNNGPGVQEYRLVVVNNDDNPGEAQSVVSTSSSSAPGNSRVSVSTSTNGSGSGGQASSWGLSSVLAGSGSDSGSSRQGLQIITPITGTNLRVALPSTGANPVANAVQVGASAATGTTEQTRSMSGGGDLSNGKLIRVISVKP